MDPTLTFAFLGVSMLFVITPGVDWAYAISSGLQQRGGVTPAVSGMLAGHLIATLVVAAGVATLLSASEAAMTILTVAGASYLVFLGTSSLRQPVATDLTDPTLPLHSGKLFTKGMGISLLNPKVFLLFLALLPQFTSAASAWPAAAQMTVLGVIHVLNCAVIYFAVGYGASKVLLSRPRAARLVGIFAGIVMVGLGVLLLGEKIIFILG